MKEQQVNESVTIRRYSTDSILNVVNHTAADTAIEVISAMVHRLSVEINDKSEVATVYELVVPRRSSPVYFVAMALNKVVESDPPTVGTPDEIKKKFGVMSAEMRAANRVTVTFADDGGNLDITGMLTTRRDVALAVTYLPLWDKAQQQFPAKVIK